MLSNCIEKLLPYFIMHDSAPLRLIATHKVTKKNFNLKVFYVGTHKNIIESWATVLGLAHLQYLEVGYAQKLR